METKKNCDNSIPLGDEREFPIVSPGYHWKTATNGHMTLHKEIFRSKITARSESDARHHLNAATFCRKRKVDSKACEDGASAEFRLPSGVAVVLICIPLTSLLLW